MPRRGLKKPILLIGLLLLLALFGVVVLCFTVGSCDGDSRAANDARKLPPQRLEKLFADMERLRALPDPSGSEHWGLESAAEFPPEFRDLDCLAIRSKGDAPLIRLRGCFDHHLDLRFHGIGEPDLGDHHAPGIFLNYGEVEDHDELLWSPPR
jgi:hypothetical protein